MKKILLVIALAMFGIQAVSAEVPTLIKKMEQPKWSHAVGATMRIIESSTLGYGLNYSAYYGNDFGKIKLSSKFVVTDDILTDNFESNTWSEVVVGARFEAWNFIKYIYSKYYPCLYGEYYIGGAYLSGVNKFYLVAQFALGMEAYISDKLQLFFEFGVGTHALASNFSNTTNKTPETPSATITIGVRF